MTGRSRHDELRRAMRRLASAFGHHDEEEAVLALLDELAAADARAADAERERDEARLEWPASVRHFRQVAAAERARADKATQALATVRAACDLPEHVAAIVGEALSFEADSASPGSLGAEGAHRCPDGSWSKSRRRRCRLPLGHAGPHVYEVNVAAEGAPPPEGTA